MVDEPAGRDPDGADQWLHTYQRSLQQQYEVATTTQAQRDQMLTWTIGLLGIGLFQAYIMLLSRTCASPSPDKPMGALLPWVLAIMCALVGRLTGAEYSRLTATMQFGQEHRFRLLMTERAGRARVQEVIKTLADDPALRQYGRLQKRFDVITHWLYLLTHVLFLIGFVFIVWRIKC